MADQTYGRSNPAISIRSAALDVASGAVEDRGDGANFFGAERTATEPNRQRRLQILQRAANFRRGDDGPGRRLPTPSPPPGVCPPDMTGRPITRRERQRPR